VTIPFCQFDVEQSSLWTPPLPPAHPGAHGPVQFRLIGDQSSEQLVVALQPELASLHRGVEKLFESRDYRQCLVLADRHEWHSAFGSELGLAMTIEEALGITVPDRGRWLRTSLAEINRIVHHLRWIGATITLATCDSPDPESFILSQSCHDLTEEWTSRIEALTGGRLHPMYVVTGGVRVDAPAGWANDVTDLIDPTQSLLDALGGWSAPQLRNLLPVSRECAIDAGASGPVGRASGLAIDLRIDDPYAAYPELLASGVLSKVVRTNGDSAARFDVLVAEVAVSLACVTATADVLMSEKLAPEINIRLPRSLRVPHGSSYGCTENPSGINGWHLTAVGGSMPHRLKIRSASLGNVAAFCAAAPGTAVADLPLALSTFLVVGGDLGR
jgi:NADH-quinone oxidoreductase subunit D